MVILGHWTINTPNGLKEVCDYNEAMNIIRLMQSDLDNLNIPKSEPKPNSRVLTRAELEGRRVDTSFLYKKGTK